MHTCLCRICATSIGVNCKHIFNTANVKKYMEKYLGLKITADDQLPKLICKNCHDQLESINQLANIGRHTQKVFTKYLRNVEASRNSTNDGLAPQVCFPAIRQGSQQSKSLVCKKAVKGKGCRCSAGRAEFIPLTDVQAKSEQIKSKYVKSTAPAQSYSQLTSCYVTPSTSVGSVKKVKSTIKYNTPVTSPRVVNIIKELSSDKLVRRLTMSSMSEFKSIATLESPIEVSKALQSQNHELRLTRDSLGEASSAAILPIRKKRTLKRSSRSSNAHIGSMKKGRKKAQSNIQEVPSQMMCVLNSIESTQKQVKSRKKMEQTQETDRCAVQHEPCFQGKSNQAAATTRNLTTTRTHSIPSPADVVREISKKNHGLPARSNEAKKLPNKAPNSAWRKLDDEISSTLDAEYKRKVIANGVDSVLQKSFKDLSCATQTAFVRAITAAAEREHALSIKSSAATKALHATVNRSSYKQNTVLSPTTGKHVPRSFSVSTKPTSRKAQSNLQSRLVTRSIASVGVEKTAYSYTPRDSRSKQKQPKTKQRASSSSNRTLDASTNVSYVSSRKAFLKAQKPQTGNEDMWK